MQKLTAPAGRRPIPKIVPDTVVDHVEDEATQFDPRLFGEDEATQFDMPDDEATQFEPYPVGATIRPSRPSKAKAPARFALGTERVPRLPPPPPAPTRTPPARQDPGARRAKPTSPARARSDSATLPRPRVAREPAANTPPVSPLPVSTPLPWPRPMIVAPRPRITPMPVADVQSLMSSRAVGAFSTARVLRAIPMLVATTAPADIALSSRRGVETERVVPLAPARRRLSIAIGVAAATVIGVVLGLLLIGNDSSDAAPRIATISRPVVTPIQAPVAPIADEPSTPASAEPAVPASEPTATVEDTTARQEPSAKRPKAKKVTHPPRRRPFSVDTSTPLGTLRVTRS